MARITRIIAANPPFVEFVLFVEEFAVTAGRSTFQSKQRTYVLQLPRTTKCLLIRIQLLQHTNPPFEHASPGFNEPIGPSI